MSTWLCPRNDIVRARGTATGYLDGQDVRQRTSDLSALGELPVAKRG